MKKILVLAMTMAVGLTSCDDFLTTSSSSMYDTNTVYNNVANSGMALMGVYSLMTDDNMYSSRLSTMLPYNSDIEVAGADEKSYIEDGNRGLSNYYATPSFSKANLDKVWKMLYKGIERANDVIYNIPKSEVMVSGDEASKVTMRVYYAEALALRSLFYFELVRNWGDVPLKLEPTLYDGSNFYLAATNRQVIYDQLLDDLKEASALLPWVGKSGYTVERVTKGFVKGLRARIALAAGGYAIRNEAGFPYKRIDDEIKVNEYYAIAKKECGELIESVENPHSLNPSFGSVFDKLCKWELDNTYQENLFEVALGYGRSGEIGYSVGIRFYANTKYGYGNNANTVNVTPYYYFMFDNDDKRREETIAFYNYGNSSGEMKEFFKNEIGWNVAKYDQRRMSKSFLEANLKANGKVGYGINYVLMRYSDVLLMYAEAANYLNEDMDKAKKAFSQVRTRAFGRDMSADVEALAAGDEFFNAIVRERACEFGGEGIRKYDLVRWGLISSKIEEQRTLFNAMIAGGSVRLPNGTTAVLANKLGVVYGVGGEVIDKKATDFYTNSTAEDAVDFLGGWSESNKTKMLSRIEKFSSGLNQEGKPANRHLLPIPAVVISESGDKLFNSYQF